MRYVNKYASKTTHYSQVVLVKEAAVDLAVAADLVHQAVQEPPVVLGPQVFK